MGNSVDFEKHYERGRRLGDKGRHEEAIVEFRKALAMQDDSDARNGLGVSLGELGRHEEAIVEFEAALKLDPEDTAVLENHGQTLIYLGRYTDAISIFQ